MRVLVISYEFPPRGGTGVQRVCRILRHLAEKDWSMEVLTVSDPPTSITDVQLLSTIPASVRINRAYSLEPTRVVQAWRRLTRRIGTFSPLSAEQATGGYTSLPLGLIRLIQTFFLPDEKVGWTPWAVQLGAKRHRERSFDAILASGPPFTAFVVARRLSDILGVPWLADFRDPVVDNCFSRRMTPLHEKWYREFELRTVRSASRIMTATEGFQRALEIRHPWVAGKVRAVFNGFDPDDFSVAVPRKRPGYTITYVGAFQQGRTPEMFLRALGKVMERRPDMARTVKVRFVGPLDNHTKDLIERLGLTAHVRRTGFVPHHKAVEEMRRADLLLLIIGMQPESGLFLTNKLPEYLAAGPEILALAPEGEAADAVRESQRGVVVPPDGITSVERALEELYEHHLNGTTMPADPAVVNRFNQRHLSDIVAELLLETRHAGSPKHPFRQ